MLTCQSHLFSLDPTVHYLNCAYMSPLARRVEDAGMRAIQAKRNPFNVSPADFFTSPESVRQLFADLVDGPKASSVSLIPSVSYGISTAAENVDVRAGQNIVLLQDQFPSNVYPWTRLAREKGLSIRTVRPRANTGDKGAAWTAAVLEQIDSDTAVVATPVVHWTDGTLFDVKAISDKAHQNGAYYVVDGTQSVGALPFSVRDVMPDALVVAGYKWMMGPYSTALAYWGDRFLDGRPLEENWTNRRGSENFARLVDYEESYQEGAIRFDAGGKGNFSLLPMMEEALKLLLEWTPEEIQRYLRGLVQPWEDAIRNAGFHMDAGSSRGGHLFGLHLPAHLDAVDVKDLLASRSVSVSVRGDVIRVAPHVYNTEEDMQSLVDALQATTAL
jgi:selenocysteine lyase/cysteine desulfurase